MQIFLFSLFSIKAVLAVLWYASVRKLRTNRAQTMRCRYGLLVVTLQNFPQSKELSCIYLKTLYFLRRARRAKMN